MKYTFDDLKSAIEFNRTRAQGGYTFPLLPRYNNIIGNLQQDQTTILSGLPGSGITSFIDQNYVISVLLQWYEIEEDERPPLKIFYYSMKTSELKKMQLLLCNYIKLVHGLHVDIATLNNQTGRLYDLSKDTKMIDAIEEATMFFDEVLNDEVLCIIDGQKQPTNIYNNVNDFMLNQGRMSSEGRFEYDADKHNLLTLLVVDSTDYFLPDNEGYGMVSGAELDDKFQRQLKELKNNYKISSVIVVPPVIGYVRSVKDTEPHYRHLGSYGALADKGICVYNPISEKNIKFYDGEETTYITSKGNNLLRTWHIVRNTEGIESVYDRLIFLPGTSFMVEHSVKEEVGNLQEVLDVIGEDTCFSNS